MAKDRSEKKIVLIAETSIMPITRANLRIYQLGRALARKGYGTYMITPSFTPFTRKSYSQDGVFMNQFWGLVKYMYTKMRSIIRLWHLLGTIASIVWLQVKYFDITVIHTWNPLAGLAAVIGGKIIHKSVYIDFTDFYSNIAVSDSPKSVGFLKWIERFVLHSAAKIFVVSENMKKSLVNLKIDPTKINIVPDGVDTHMFRPDVDIEDIRNRLGLNNNTHLIIYHGDIKYPDGVDLLYYAFQKILMYFPQTKLLMLGGGGSYFKNVIVKLGEDLGLSYSIIYTGWVPHTDVPKYIAASNIGAMPMRNTLNNNCYLSFKLFEYWACGKPIVVSRLKAISKIVKDGINGYIFEPGDIEGMAQAYIRLLKDPEKCVQMGIQGRKLVESDYNWDVLMDKEVRAYDINTIRESL